MATSKIGHQTPLFQGNYKAFRIKQNGSSIFLEFAENDASLAEGTTVRLVIPTQASKEALGIQKTTNGSYDWEKWLQHPFAPAFAGTRILTTNEFGTCYIPISELGLSSVPTTVLAMSSFTPCNIRYNYDESVQNGLNIILTFFDLQGNAQTNQLHRISIACWG